MHCACLRGSLAPRPLCFQAQTDPLNSSVFMGVKIISKYVFPLCRRQTLKGYFLPILIIRQNIMNTSEGKILVSPKGPPAGSAACDGRETTVDFLKHLY